jgi:hypothetical protein
VLSVIGDCHTAQVTLPPLLGAADAALDAALLEGAALLEAGAALLEGAALLDAGAALLDEAGLDDATLLEDAAGALVGSGVGAAQATANNATTRTTNNNKRLYISFSSLMICGINYLSE